MCSSVQPVEDKLGELTRGRSTVLVTATETEAEPLRAALVGVTRVEVATKSIYLGELRAARQEQGRVANRAREDTGDATIPLVLAVSGCDKANAAHVLTCLLQAMRPAPRAVLQVGIAGGFHKEQVTKGLQTAAGGPEIGDIVVATQEVYSDTGSSSPEGWLSAADLGLPIACVQGVDTGGVFSLAPDLVEAAREAIDALDWRGGKPQVHVGPCVTSSQVTGLQSEMERLERWGALAESMEGAVGAHICTLYEVPFLEIRGISNLVGDRDRSSWQVERAAAVAARAALSVVMALAVA